MNKCFLSDKTDCELAEVPVGGVIYYVDEVIADDLSLKKLVAMVTEKIEKIKSEKETIAKKEAAKKEKAMNDLTAAVDALGISREDLGRLLLGQKATEITNAPIVAEVATPVQTAQAAAAVAQRQVNVDDGFIAVDGELKSKNMQVRAEDDISGSVPAYSYVRDKDGQSISESNKRIKRLDDGGIIQRSDMGTTVMRIINQDPGLDKVLRQVDSDGNLLRAAPIRNSALSGLQTADCPLCAGSGITRIGYKTCPKCNGTGLINV